MLPRKAAAAVVKEVVEEVKKKPEVKTKQPPKVALKKVVKAQEIEEKVGESEKKSEQTNVAAICKDAQPKNESENDDRRAGNKRTRKIRGRCNKRIDSESSSDEDSTEHSNKPADKQWQTSSSHSEHSESEEDMEPFSSDPGSSLFKSDHEFSPESDVDDTTQVQPVKQARTAKNLKAVSSSDGDEDIACQVCHKTDSPEWILLCDGCDCAYHCSCLKPIIFLIPSGNWFCPLCCHKKLITNLTDQLTQLDTLINNIEKAELRSQRKKLQKITQQNILSYKLRKRTAPSYRFDEYDYLIDSAISEDIDEVKGAGNLGRGKDMSTIVEVYKEEKEQQDDVVAVGDEDAPKAEKDEGDVSSGSNFVRPKKSVTRKKQKKKLNNLDASSEDERVSDEDFKGTFNKSKGRNVRKSTRNKGKRYDSDDEPLIKAKRAKKKYSENFNDDDDDDEGSQAENIDTEDLCDDTETN